MKAKDPELDKETKTFDVKWTPYVHWSKSKSGVYPEIVKFKSYVSAHKFYSSIKEASKIET